MSSGDGNLLRVSRVSVRALFGIYDHEFELNAQSRVTILHGPNGVGKTILLKCVSALFDGRYSFLKKTPFKWFNVYLSDGTHIAIHREEKEAPTGALPRRLSPAEPAIEMTCELRAGGTKQVFIIKASADVGRLATFIEQHSPYVMRVAEETWIDRRTNRYLTAEEVVEENPEVLNSGRASKLREAEPDPLREIRRRVKVSLIETDRLIRFTSEDWEYGRGGGSKLQTTVNEYAKHLQKQIEATSVQYGRRAQQLDQSFPQRLIQEQVPALELSELKRRMEQLEARQQELTEVGLLDKIPTRPFDPGSLDDADPTKLGPMTLYLLDSESKISSFDAIAARLKLLLDSAKIKFKNKSLVISKEKGLQAQGANGENLSLDALSSGEQHEIVLMYELLFKTTPNTLILIDEPELSLHVSWQRMFLPELLSVVKTVGFDVVLATHSPFIVGGRTDLMVGLDMDRDDMPHQNGGRIAADLGSI